MIAREKFGTIFNMFHLFPGVLQREVRGERSQAPGQAPQLGLRRLLERAARPVVEAPIGVKSRLFSAVFFT